MGGEADVLSIHVRLAEDGDLAGIKAVLDAHRRELGFVPAAAVRTSIGRGWLCVAEQDGAIVGVVDWWARRDSVVVLYSIAVLPPARGHGAGRALLWALIGWAGERGAHMIRLKCPVDLAANDFYQRHGFTLAGSEEGKRRALNLWTLALSAAGVQRNVPDSVEL